MKKICSNNFNVNENNQKFDFGAITTIGNREEQQDCIGYDIKSNKMIAVICDGMGGHEGGEIASQTAVERLLTEYYSLLPFHDIDQFFVESVIAIDGEISRLTKDDGTPLMAGTTIVAVIIIENQLHWLSVGDSRIYLYRNGELVRPTVDHNYSLLLKQRLLDGEITEKDYQKESEKGSMLISFLGKGDLPMIDYSSTPLSLFQGDVILLSSDGMFKNLSEKDICKIIKNYDSAEDAVIEMEKRATKQARIDNKKRDNVSLLMIKIK